MRNLKDVSRKGISLILVCSFLLSMLSGCASKPTAPNSEIDSEQIVDEVSEYIIENLSAKMMLSTNWEDYVGDVEAFVDGLIGTELGYQYDVFPASAELPNGDSVCGIAYTDYSTCYANDLETEVCFEAGFIPAAGELAISQEDFDSGIRLRALDYVDNTYSFLYAYASEPFTEHCVVYGKYVKYGVDETGRLFYETEDYERGHCDETLGSLYSYDEAKYVYDVDLGEYVGISGTSLSEQIDYEDLEAEINRILETQDLNFATVDVESCAYFAQGAVQSYLLSLQQETFLGYDVATLVEEVAKLDPVECFQMTREGPQCFDPKGGASTLTKWMVGSACVIAIAVGMVGSIVSIECPPLSAASSALAGTAIEIFMQVVISGEALEDVNWNKVAMAAVTGAVSGFLGPYVYATTEGAAYFFMDSALDGLVGGIEHAVSAWMDGEDAAGVIKSMGYGFALGFAMSAGFKGVGAVVGKLAKKIGPSLSNAAEKLAPKLTAKVSALSGAVGEAILQLKAAADSSAFHSKYISKKLAAKQIQRLVQENADELLDNSLDHLGVNDIVDANGAPMDKAKVRELANAAKDGDVIAHFKKGDEMVDIVKKNGIVSIEFDASKYQTVALPNGLTNSREANFEKAAELYKKQWLDDPTQMPDSIAKAISDSGIDLEAMTPQRLSDLIRSSDWVMHESADLTTIMLVPRYIHDVASGGISHAGGIAILENLKLSASFGFFDRFVSAAATGAVQATA